MFFLRAMTGSPTWYIKSLKVGQFDDIILSII